MHGRTSRTRRLPLGLVACLLVVAGAAIAAAVAQGRGADDTIVAQTVTPDPIGDEASNGPDLSNLTITTYADQTLEVVVQYANRGLLLGNETVQVFIDLNDDGIPDIDYSLWPSGSTSYLERWNGTTWTIVRGLTEAVQSQGTSSVRLPVSVLRDAAGVTPGTQIGVLAGSYTYSGATLTPSDWLPDNRIAIQHALVATTPTTTAPPATTTPKPPAPRGPLPALRLACLGHEVRATVKPPKRQRIVFVTFSVNGNARSTDTRSPFVATFRTKSLHTPIKIGAAVHFATRTATVQKTLTKSC
jgi:hypothetical protein